MQAEIIFSFLNADNYETFNRVQELFDHHTERNNLLYWTSIYKYNHHPIAKNLFYVINLGFIELNNKIYNQLVWNNWKKSIFLCSHYVKYKKDICV